MKKTKIVIPALAVLLLSTAASVSGTVAWFSMNTAINVTGMTVTTKVSSSLQIAETNAEQYFSNANLQQTRAGLLEPASTIDGYNYFYTTDAKSNGAARQPSYVAYDESDIRNGNDPRTEATETNFSNALSNDYAAVTGKTSYDPKFHDAYGFPAYDPSAATTTGASSSNEVPFAYIDYSFYLKAFMQSTEKIALTNCNMLYDGGSLGQEHAWRVAFFAHKVDLGVAESNDTTTSAEGNLISVLDFAQSKNQNEVEAVEIEVGDEIPADTLYAKADLSGNPVAAIASATASEAGTYYKAKAGETAPKAVSATDATAPVKGQSAGVNNEAKITVAQSGTHVFKVVVRLWLEGEDVTCKSDTFASLTNSWTLELGFKLGSEAGVQNITNVVPQP